MRTAIAVLVLAAALPSAAGADVVADWMTFATAIVAADAPPPYGQPANPKLEHARTQVALAIFEAVNAIDHRYQSFLGFPRAPHRASQDAAAAAAAHAVLLALYPGQATIINDNYAVAMAGVTDAAARDAGREVGEAAAALALQAGAIDPAMPAQPYRPMTVPGVYIGTTLPTIEPYELSFKPWVMASASAFRPAPPPALTSERYARDLDEVKRLGGRDSTERTPIQTLMARYRITPDLMPTLRAITDLPGRSRVRNARLFALLGVVGDDAGMAAGEAKLHYNFWRPITAIRNADQDGNPATERDAGWMSLINTPGHPEYPCAHCTYAAAMATVLEAEVGVAPPGGVRVASRSLPTAAVQTLPDFATWVREVSFSRTLGGVHYRFSNEAGEKIGRDVARLALRTAFLPAP